MDYGALSGYFDGVLRTMMPAFQRRKSRVSTAFENQLAHLFDARGIRY